MNRKPPLPVSPRRLRPRRPPTTDPSFQTLTAKNTSKPPAPFLARNSVAGETPPLRHEHSIYSSKDGSVAGHDPFLCPIAQFERGRFYDLYSARREERLKRKMMEISGETDAYYHVAAVELPKKKVFKKSETPRKSMLGNFSMSRASTLRSSAAKRKMMEISGETATCYSVAAVEFPKKTVLKEAETPRKSVPGNFSMSRASTLRSSTAKRKMMEISGEAATYYPVAAVDLPKKMVLKEAETPRKSMPGNFSVSRARTLRSSAAKRSDELKKNSFSVFSVTSSVDVGKKMMTRSAAAGFSAVPSSVDVGRKMMTRSALKKAI